ncbi:MAG: Hsp20/alpha crystallin family protein [Desertimonas sp.]
MIVRTRPFISSFDAQRVDRVFGELTRSLTNTGRGPAVDASWHDGALRLTVDLPGVPDEAISVDVADHTLAIAVDHDGTAWQRSVRLGDQLDPSQVSARYLNGRLSVTVQPAPEPEKRSIALDTTPAPAVEATVSDETDADGQPGAADPSTAQA